MARPKKATSTKLGLQHIKDENKKYQELKKVVIEDVGYTEIYRYFSNKKIESMLEDFSRFVEEYQKIVGQMSEKQIIEYIMLFTILHFSSLVESVPEALEEKLDIFEQILNSEIGEKVAESFNKNEVAKIMERMMKKLEAIQQIAKENVEMRNKLKEYVENSELENKSIILNTMFKDEMSEEIVE